MNQNTNRKNQYIEISTEREIWRNKLLNKLIPVPDSCQYYNKGIFILQNKNNLINPLIAKCSFYQCRKEKYLLIGTIFEYNYKTPVSVLYYILKLWLGEEKNVQEIKNKLIETYNLEDLNPIFIYKFFTNCRKALANYIRSIYVLDPLA